MRIRKNARNLARHVRVAALSLAALLTASDAARAQRLLGIDISAWQRQYFDQPIGIRCTTRTTGTSSSSVPAAVARRASTTTTITFSLPPRIAMASAPRSCLSHRYDDPYFGQNITRATNAGLFAGTYHRSQANDHRKHAEFRRHCQHRHGRSQSHDSNGRRMDAARLSAAGARLRGRRRRCGPTSRNGAIRARLFQPHLRGDGHPARDLYQRQLCTLVLGGGTAAQRSELANNPAIRPVSFRLPFQRCGAPAGPTKPTPTRSTFKTLIRRIRFANIYGPWDDYGVTHPWAVLAIREHRAAQRIQQRQQQYRR